MNNLSQELTAFQRFFYFLRDNPKILEFLAKNAWARNIVFGHPETIEASLKLVQRMKKTVEVKPFTLADVPDVVWWGAGGLLLILLMRRK